MKTSPFLLFTSKSCLSNLLAALLLSVSSEALAQNHTFRFDPDSGKVSFIAIGRPQSLKVHGVGVGAEGKLLQNNRTVTGTLQFSLATLKTGIALRDKHMTENYLQTDKHPNASFTLTEFDMPSTEIPTNASSLPFKGLLKIKGIEKPIQGTVNLSVKDENPTLIATFPLKLTDFNIEIPKYLGITVAEEVTVTVEATAVKTSDEIKK